jgi:outer membrane protein assembly factor BamB
VKWVLGLGAVFLLALAAGLGAWWYLGQGGVKEIRGSSTVEFKPNPVIVKRPPKALEAVPWPTYGYDNARSHVSPFDHRPPYRRLWTVRTGWYLEFPPSIGYGRVFVSQQRGLFLALDPETGRRIWTKHFPFCSAASPTLADGLVIQTYVPPPCSNGSRSAPGLVVAMRASDGKIVWRIPLASESTALVVGGLAYLGAWDHKVYALDLKTGKTVWSTDTDGEINSSPAFGSGTVFIGNNAGSIYALDAKTGRVRWIGRSFSSFIRGREYFYATPTVGYGRVFAPNTDGTVYAFGETTGHLLWARHVGTYVYTAPAVWNRTVYVGTYDGNFDALDAATGDPRWVYEAPAAIHGAPTLMAGLVYFSTCGRCGQHGVRHAKSGPYGTYALDARSGKLEWTFPDGHYSPITADEKRVYLTGSTRIYGLAPVTGG